MLCNGFERTKPATITMRPPIILIAKLIPWKEEDRLSYLRFDLYNHIGITSFTVIFLELKSVAFYLLL